ncbi:sigma 54-interacting transcriptional regulator [Geomesophilobacter sediminis]|uniref:Sigma-54-dependent Fis family transcriptional regulator n=1 Tax=Geomesophilobacter sediminis TaxID=2798584 RepID=A0A8J7LTD2_9BACT|nr:sigma-54 dependent transcriptional regulator [Geomesophilobacter sediminis]MBJ6723269.1 sigma-54-dependent Fis family transcriptional regulator [Geomesophilobacter sediminis]
MGTETVVQCAIEMGSGDDAPNGGDGAIKKAFSPILTQSPKLRGIFEYLTAVAGTGQPVLVTGETGVGKELVARSLHDASGRCGPFVAVNVAGLDDHMFSDALFGHGKGAFTGADQSRDGLVARAAEGTLFLDEIGDLSLQSQIKLLRLLQEGEYYPLGTDRPRKSSARVVVATNCDLSHKMGAGLFRKDLYYRLNAHHASIPPLRERLEDLPLLVDFFLDQAAQILERPRPAHPPELIDYLKSYDFPGNVRQLKAMLFDAVARHRRGVLSLSSFRQMIGARRGSAVKEPLEYLRRLGDEKFGARMPTLKEAEEALIAHALEAAGGNQGIAASYLGITRQALNKRLARRKESSEK